MKNGKLEKQDLMIGDWVKFPIGNERIIDLPYIMGKGICASFAASATLFPVEVEKLEPIPLTPEILEKNGAHKNKLMGEQRHFEYCLNNLMLLAIYDADFSFQINGGARKIKYVHELQHVLKLCGIEKNIII